jgi:hypothetical protein
MHQPLSGKLISFLSVLISGSPVRNQFTCPLRTFPRHGTITSVYNIAFFLTRSPSPPSFLSHFVVSTCSSLDVFAALLTNVPYSIFKNLAYRVPGEYPLNDPHTLNPPRLTWLWHPVAFTTFPLWPFHLATTFYRLYFPLSVRLIVPVA